MRKLSNWTILRRRLDPLLEPLLEIPGWPISPVIGVERWLYNLNWKELQICDIVIEGWLCTKFSLPPCLDTPDNYSGIMARDRLLQQLVYRMFFALDLSERMGKVWRDENPLTSDPFHDNRQVLINAWRTSAALNWARGFGHKYCFSPPPEEPEKEIELG